MQVFALATNLFNNRYANFGTFAETGAVAGNFVINDPAPRPWCSRSRPMAASG